MAASAMSDKSERPTYSQPPGEQLRLARVGYGWSIEDVAGNLNLTVDVVRALESGDHSNLPEAAFVRGYLRAYARLMEIDETVVLTGASAGATESIGSVIPVLGKEAFKEKKGRQWLKFSEKKKSTWRKPLLVSIVVVIAVIAAWWFSGLLPTFQQLIKGSDRGQGESGVITIPLNTQN